MRHTDESAGRGADSSEQHEENDCGAQSVHAAGDQGGLLLIDRVQCPNVRILSNSCCVFGESDDCCCSMGSGASKRKAAAADADNARPPPSSAPPPPSVGSFRDVMVIAFRQWCATLPPHRRTRGQAPSDVLRSNGEERKRFVFLVACVFAEAEIGAFWEREDFWRMALDDVAPEVALERRSVDAAATAGYE